jgi:ubiquinol-cytochrome c reductase iron-sulfur subunit
MLSFEGCRGIKSRGVIVASSETHESNRRDFLYIATGAFAAVGAASAAWPLIHQMNPDASVQALSSIEIDMSAIPVGQTITVKWQGRPVFIRHRTPEEIKISQDTPLEDLKDPVARNAGLAGSEDASDANRVIQPEWLIVIGVCTHLGCIPVKNQGDYNGWFCPCHGSHYDLAGRIRFGPAPENLLVPKYEFIGNDAVRIG